MSKAKKFKDLVKKKEQPDNGKEARKDEWVSDVAALFEEIGGWLGEEEIKHRAHTVDFNDDKIGQYKSLMLVIMPDGYEATIRPEYSAPIGKGRCVRVKSGKKSGGNVKLLTRDTTGRRLGGSSP